ncbi:MAG TPA: hypothetical protein VNX28_10525 [Gemmataceae bacterium]|jgi:hypothetical protein|nr:hypothetical protein [Gemmataceae bacterium]
MAVTMDFGKHKGRPLAEVDTGYLEWALAEATNLGPRMRLAIEDELDRRFARDDEATDGVGPAVQIDGIITRWYRQMSLEFHPDRGGHVEAMKAINVGMERLRELAQESIR